MLYCQPAADGWLPVAKRKLWISKAGRELSGIHREERQLN